MQAEDIREITKLDMSLAQIERFGQFLVAKMNQQKSPGIRIVFHAAHMREEGILVRYSYRVWGMAMLEGGDATALARWPEVKRYRETWENAADWNAQNWNG